MSKEQIGQLLIDITNQLTAKISIIIMAIMSSAIVLINKLKNNEYTLIQSIIASITAFILGIIIGTIAWHLISSKGIVLAITSSSSLLSESIIKYILSHDDAIVKRISKWLTKKIGI